MNSPAANSSSDNEELISAVVYPRGSLEFLSHQEVEKLFNRGQGSLYPLLRSCALAVLNSGSTTDNHRELFEKYKTFDFKIVSTSAGLLLELTNSPPQSFVDGEMIEGIREHLFAVLRDIVFIDNEIIQSGLFDLQQPESITNAVYCILRHANVLQHNEKTNLVVCWGGHSISREEYDYSKLVGYELGLRQFDVCTGCGPGAMKGPMKGAVLGHAKQRIASGRYIGLTEPGIVAAEPPNAIVNRLVIMPDIEKRLEGFVRLAHGIVVFPGGVGTAEEILYLLGTLLDPANNSQVMPLIFTGPASAAEYFSRIDDFIHLTLGPAAQSLYKIIIDDPAAVARELVTGSRAVRDFRQASGDSYHFNWNLRIPPDFQMPFVVSHESVKAFPISLEQPLHVRAANLRRIFSAIVAGNCKEQGIRAVEAHGPFLIHGDTRVVVPLDALLASFVAQNRMSLAGNYKPVYRLIG